MAGLPAGVQRQLDEADAIQRSLSLVKPGDEVPGDEAAGTGADAAAASLVAADDDPTPTVTPPAEQPPQQDPFETKYKVLQGKYNSEVPALHAQLRKLTTDLDVAMQKIALLTERKPEEQPPKPASELVTQEEFAEYGEELIGLVQRIAQQTFNAMAAPLYSRLVNELKPIQEQATRAEQVSAQTQEEIFFGRLADKVRNWATINTDARFLEWLSAPVSEFSDETRHSALNRAVAKGDVDKAATFFTKFIEEVTPPQAPSTSLQQQAAPPKSGNGTPPPPQKKIWTMKEYQDAWDHRAYQKMPAAEVDALRADADQALAEGRVR